MINYKFHLKEFMILSHLLLFDPAFLSMNQRNLMMYNPRNTSFFISLFCALKHDAF